MELNSLLPEYRVAVAKRNKHDLKWVKGDVTVVVSHYCGGSRITVKRGKLTVACNDRAVSSDDIVEYVKQKLS